MTVYARSDVCYVAISRDHGGCGEGHARPVVYGAPAKVWSLTCHGGCEDLLRHDPLWAATPQAIPETPDEVVIREDVEKRGQVEQAASVAEALQKLAALGDLPSALLQVMSQLMAGQQHGVIVEPDTRVALAAQSSPPAIEDAPPADDPGESSEPVSAPADSSPDLAALEALSLADLKEIAQSHGLPTTRAKADQINIILQALGA